MKCIFRSHPCTGHMVIVQNFKSDASLDSLSSLDSSMLLDGRKTAKPRQKLNIINHALTNVFRQRQGL